MSEPVFVIQNQHGLYLTRHNEWNDGHDAAALFKTPHRDIALNTLIELNAKDIELRGNIIGVPLNEKGIPVVTPTDAISVLHDSAQNAGDTEQADTGAAVAVAVVTVTETVDDTDTPCTDATTHAATAGAGEQA